MSTTNWSIEKLEDKDLAFDNWQNKVQTDVNKALDQIDKLLYTINSSTTSLGLLSVTHGALDFVSISANKYTLSPTDYFVYVPVGNITITLPATTTIGKTWLVGNADNTITLRTLPIKRTQAINGAITVTIVPSYKKKTVVCTNGTRYIAY